MCMDFGVLFHVYISVNAVCCFIKKLANNLPEMCCFPQTFSRKYFLKDNVHLIESHYNDKHHTLSVNSIHLKSTTFLTELSKQMT